MIDIKVIMVLTYRLVDDAGGVFEDAMASEILNYNIVIEGLEEVCVLSYTMNVERYIL
jgi:hypothetical protein